jgi:Skp family chaperone for outer membrane proteins
MKKTAFVLGAFIFVMFFVGKLQAAEKFACMDLARVFNEYGKTKEYDKTLSEEENSYTQELDKKTNEIKQLQDKMNLLSDKEKEAKKPDMESKLKALQEFKRTKETDLRKELVEKRDEIFKDIQSAVKKYSEKEGLTLVFNDQVLVYQDKTLDITDKIIQALNKENKK